MCHQRRLTSRQQYALKNYQTRYCLAPTQRYDFSKVFARKASVIMEIGFGDGNSLVQMALDNPDKNYIGVEVYRPGIGHLLNRLAHQKINNVRVFCHDAIAVLEHCCNEKSLNGIHLFFPDPWPKRKHHKRRIVNQYFVNLLTKSLVIEGYFHAATDWQPYAEAMLANLSATKAFANANTSNNFYSSKPDHRPLTKFEQRGLSLGLKVWDLIFIKTLSCPNNLE